MTISTKILKLFLLPVISAILYSITFPKLNILPIAYIALIPLLFSVDGSNWKNGFISGLVFGTVSGMFMVYWTTVAMAVYGGISWFFSYLLLIALGLILGLIFFAPFIAFFSSFKYAKIPEIIFFPALWVSFEWLKTFIFSGFPWNLFGYSQFSFLKIIQISDITGVFGVSFLLVFINTCLFVTLREFIQGKKFRVRWLVSAGLLFLITFIYGTIQEKNGMNRLPEARL